MQFRKRKTREIAMQILFAWDSQGNADPAIATQIAASSQDSSDTGNAAVEIAHAVWAQLATLDAWVERLAPKWPPRRQPGVDRSLLRLAAWELTSQTAPPAVAIDEAVDLAKQFSTEQSARFINGVLDSMRKEQASLLQAQGEPSAPLTPPGESSPEAKESE